MFGVMPEDDTATRLRAQLEHALAQYTAERDRFRYLRSSIPADADSASIHDINAQYRALISAQQELRTVRRAFRGLISPGRS